MTVPETVPDALMFTLPPLTAVTSTFCCELTATLWLPTTTPLMLPPACK